MFKKSLRRTQVLLITNYVLTECQATFMLNKKLNYTGFRKSDVKKITKTLFYFLLTELCQGLGLGLDG